MLGLLEHVLPYYERNPQQFETKALKPLSLDDRKAAVALSRESSEVLVAEQTQDGLWFYCRKRQNGVRCTLSNAEVRRFEAILAKKDRTYEEFCFVSAIRKFNLHSCTCRKQANYLRCLHRRTVGIRSGEVNVTELEEPDLPKQSNGPKESGKTRALKGFGKPTYCFFCQKDCKNSHNLKEHLGGVAHTEIMQDLYLKVTKGGEYEKEAGALGEHAKLIEFSGDESSLTPGRYVVLAGDAVGRQLLQARVCAVERGDRQKIKLHVTLASGQDRIINPSLILRLIETEEGNGERRT